MEWLRAKPVGLAAESVERPRERERGAGGWLTFSEELELHTRVRTEILDLTEQVEEHVRRSGIREGLTSVCVLHTTAAVVVNENEPLLLGDMLRLLERLVPDDAGYQHDAFARRWPPPPPDERENGAAHCRALLLGGSKTLQVAAGALHLGRWQRVLLLELDGPRTRKLALHTQGSAR